MKGVSFRLGREKLGIVGESGSGKSTVLRTVMGLNRNWSGDIRISDIDMRKGRRQNLVRIAQIVFQDPYASLPPLHDCRADADQPRPDASDRTVGLLELIGLAAEHCFHFPHELSGGQRQRVAIARALSLSPGCCCSKSQPQRSTSPYRPKSSIF